MELDLKLPHITKELPGIGGTIREIPENFIVEEIPLYEPSGEGEYLYVNITKKNLTTKEVSEKLAKIFNISNKNVSFAGMKDKNAVTTQTFSIKTEKMDEVKDLIESNIPVTVNWTKLHKNKLKIGHLLGNKFTILITKIDISSDEALERITKIVNEIKKTGLPNFFGPQRFGYEGKNVEKGLKILGGTMNVRNKWMRKFLISSYQSYLCNIYLLRRIEKGFFNKILMGDVAKKYETGGMFDVEDLENEQKRYENHEISFTAPIYGYKMWGAKGPSEELEKKVLSEAGMDKEKLRSAKVKGTRRLGRLLIPDISFEMKEKDVLLKFSLPKGAFATNVLREIRKNK